MVSCCVPNCKNKGGLSKTKNEGITYHRFPRNPKMKLLWIKAIKREDWAPKVNNRLCSVHFEDKHFYFTGMGLRYLFEGAMPTLYLPTNLENHKSTQTDLNVFNYIALYEKNTGASTFIKKETIVESSIPSTSFDYNETQSLCLFDTIKPDDPSRPDEPSTLEIKTEDVIDVTDNHYTPFDAIMSDRSSRVSSTALPTLEIKTEDVIDDHYTSFDAQMTDRSSRVSSTALSTVEIKTEDVTDDHYISFDAQMTDKSPRISSTALHFYKETPTTMGVSKEFEEETDYTPRELKLLQDVKRFKLLFEKNKSKVKTLYQNKRRNNKTIERLKTVIKSMEDKKLLNNGDSFLSSSTQVAAS